MCAPTQSALPVPIHVRHRVRCNATIGYAEHWTETITAQLGDLGLLGRAGGAALCLGFMTLGSAQRIAA